jgi:hypothetical protein
MGPPSSDDDNATRLEAARAALFTDRTIDILTTGARTGRQRRTEIWFTNIEGRIIICGTPSASGDPGRRQPRDWLANLRAHPEFRFCFKESVRLTIPARAKHVVDPDDRREIMSAPQTAWYRDQGFTVSELVQGSPIVEVRFLGDYRHLTPPHPS